MTEIRRRGGGRNIGTEIRKWDGGKKIGRR